MKVASISIKKYIFSISYDEVLQHAGHPQDKTNKQWNSSLVQRKPGKWKSFRRKVQKWSSSIFLLNRAQSPNKYIQEGNSKLHDRAHKHAEESDSGIFARTGGFRKNSELPPNTFEGGIEDEKERKKRFLKFGREGLILSEKYKDWLSFKLCHYICWQ